MPILHDFRSDTVTRPSAEMRAAMAQAPVGDDVYGDDPTVAALEAEVARRTGKDEGAFFPTGTQSNLAALMVHCARGDEYIAGQQAHCYRFEAGGAAVLGSIQPQPIENLPDGTMALEKIEKAIKLDDMHFARTRLLALENTIGGRVLPQAFVADALGLARRAGLATHLDGARIFNAAVASGIAPADLAEGFDTVSVCLSKGLGAPVGTVLAGSDASIGKAKRIRKMLGGGMRQSGIVAAGALHALAHNVERLAEDHWLAATLAEGLARHEGLLVEAPQTNIVFMDCPGIDGTALAAFLAERGVIVSGRYGQLRWVTHLDVGEDAVEAALAGVAAFLERVG
ncbi:low-specificity L-threonine aldolase [Pelagibacterium montanilacus]|uniref:low-specificity L-threonine aldolase n=1 Tax=Pelagibacterium montanilacus TaxID=2185280 RepID=UPI001FE53949|nr:low-specificity L-threonine aldolase [Pelagibacterium montanilacus]